MTVELSVPVHTSENSSEPSMHCFILSHLNFPSIHAPYPH